MNRRRQPRGAILLIVLIIGALMITMMSVPIGAAYRLRRWNRYQHEQLQKRAATIRLARPEPADDAP